MFFRFTGAFSIQHAILYKCLVVFASERLVVLRLTVLAISFLIVYFSLDPTINTIGILGKKLLNIRFDTERN